MKITKVQIHPVAVKRRHRTVVGSGSGMEIPGADAAPTESEFAFLELETDEGISGVGEWSDLGQAFDPVAMQRQLEENLVGINPFDLEALFAHLQVDRSTCCAVDSALYDLMGRALEVPVYQLIGGRVRERVEVSWVVYIRQVKLISTEIQQMQEMGFNAFKLKVGADIGHDETCVRLIRQTAGPQAQIKLDASGVWSLEEAIAYIRRLEQYGLQGVESPVRGRCAADLARVREAVNTRIIEHVWDRWDYVLDLVHHQAVDIINLFPEGCGGIFRCKKVLAVAEAAGIEALLGSTVELGVGTAAQVHLGVSSPGITYPSDLIGPAMYQEDVIDPPFEYMNGGLAPRETPGLGVALDRAQLRRLKK
ncbi:MAG: mandelate racemase/muconate lactonizing enzyme family protein [Candidatus Latescibacteria bacterium]|nr:mandelate racemase/muconate lactonizing enzyme family protein [Candidatus Latescibacterota bacterium]